MKRKLRLKKRKTMTATRMALMDPQRPLLLLLPVEHSLPENPGLLPPQKNLHPPLPPPPLPLPQASAWQEYSNPENVRGPLGAPAPLGLHLRKV